MCLYGDESHKYAYVDIFANLRARKEARKTISTEKKTINRDVTETKNSKCTLYILTKEPRKAPNWKFSLLYKREGSRDGLENICLNAKGTLRQH